MLTAKEVTTPVVSAISDAAEVTISKPKDKESPVKNRKPKESVPKDNKELPVRDIKELVVKDNKEFVMRDVKELKELPLNSQEKFLKEESKVNLEEQQKLDEVIIIPNKDVKECSNLQKEDKKAQRKDKVEVQKVVNPNAHENVAEMFPMPITTAPLQDLGEFFLFTSVLFHLCRRTVLM